MLSADRELRWLRLVRDLSQRLAGETDPDALLALILDSAVEITEAERGFLVLVSTKSGAHDLTVKEARGFDRAQLAREVADVSRTVVERVLKREEGGLVTTSAEDQDVVDVTSVKARRVVSILCVPMRLRGAVRGVLYLDHRFTRGAFREEDLQILRPFADQAAVALETAEFLADRSKAPGAVRTALGELETLRTADEEPGPACSKVRRFGQLVGSSPAMGALYEEIERAARSWSPVLIFGEPGTEVEAVAREIHARSSRAGAPFVALDCARGESPIESELLGHRRGARPWARSDREGLLVLAGEGTLLLRGIDELASPLQLELVRALREGQVTPMGARRSRDVRCRVVATTHEDLRRLVESDRFRADLYYQLDAQRVIVPPLRQRSGDLPLHVEAFALAEPSGAPLELSPHALKLLEGYAWPGNTRELKNEVARLSALGQFVTAASLSPEIQEGRGVKRSVVSFAGLTLSEMEREMLKAALDDCGGNKARAARQLGIPRSTLYHLLERHAL